MKIKIEFTMDLDDEQVAALEESYSYSGMQGKTARQRIKERMEMAAWDKAAAAMDSYYEVPA